MVVSRGYGSEPRCCYFSHSSHKPKANILIDRTGHARLAGFSLLTIASDQPTTIPSDVTGGAIQWMSPELINPAKFNLNESRPTKKSDCYALGMVIFEVLSEQVPFAPREGTAIISNIVDGERPGRPQGREGERFPDDLWRMLEACWKPQPDDRPSLDIVLTCLQDGGKPRQGGSRERLISKMWHKASKFTIGKPHGP